MLPSPVVQTHDGIAVVRDDLLPGGTKRRAMAAVLRPNEEFVYASPAYGYAQIALAHAARDVGARVSIFTAMRGQMHARTAAANAAGAKIVQVPVGYLAVVQKRARDYCAKTGANLVPFGLDMPPFIEAMADVARGIAAPREAWSVAGSGVLTRALQMAWPSAAFHAVVIGKKDCDIGRATRHIAPERFEAPARVSPPFPSCDNYDAKAWAFISSAASPGALFWNVA